MRLCRSYNSDVNTSIIDHSTFTQFECPILIRRRRANILVDACRREIRRQPFAGMLIACFERGAFRIREEIEKTKVNWGTAANFHR